MAGRLYIIDYGSGRILGAGPGKQPAMELLDSQQAHPPGIEALDPYSWDVYCLGHLFWELIEVCHWSVYYLLQPVYLTYVPKVKNDGLNRDELHCWIAKRYARWLIGEERGCKSICYCRPTARRARQVASMLLLTVCILGAIGRVGSYAAQSIHSVIRAYRLAWWHPPRRW